MALIQSYVFLFLASRPGRKQSPVVWRIFNLLVSFGASRTDLRVTQPELRA